MDTARTGMSATQILRIVLLLVIIVLAVWLVYTIRGTLLPFGVAFVLSYVLTPLVDHMESRGLNRMAGVLVIYASTLAVLIAVFILIVPVLAQGVIDMKDRFVGERAMWPCVVVNQGERPIHLERTESSNPEAFSLLSPSLPVELLPGARDTLEVYFTPSDLSPQGGELTLYVRTGEGGIGSFGFSLTGNCRSDASEINWDAACVLSLGPAHIAFSDTTHQFGEVTSGYLTHFKSQIRDLQPQLESVLPMFEEINITEEINTRVNSFMTDMLKKTPELVGSIVSAITFLVIVPLVVFFFLSEGRAIKRAFIEMVPNQYFEMVLNLLYRIDSQLGGYIRGLILSVMLISMLSIALLRMISLKDYLVVGIIAGLANVIPYLGPIIGIVVGVVAAVLQYSTLSAGVILPVVLVFLAVQIMDNVFVQPVVVARSVNLHPLVVVFVVLVGNQLFGAVGMLLAVPVTAVIKVSAQTIYEGLRSYSIT